ncbi:MAG: alpha/beta fold hydrolase [Bacteroidota bacterium]
MPRLHLISGLAADRSAFDRLGTFTSLPLNYIDWLPNHPEEPLADYAQRLIKHYQIREDDLLLGLSFGGLVSLEIARILASPKVILLSSFRDKQDLQPPLYWSLRLGLHRIIPKYRLRLINGMLKYQFSAVSEAGRKVLDRMLNQSDLALTKWSVQKIAETKYRPLAITAVYSLLGDADRMVRTWPHEQLSIIPGGGHFMVFEQAEAVTAQLKKILV